MNYSFIPAEHNPLFSTEEPLAITNALSEAIGAMRLSMMPEGLMNGLTEAEVADLAAYLRTTAQTPPPNGQ